MWESRSKPWHLPRMTACAMRTSPPPPYLAQGAGCSALHHRRHQRGAEGQRGAALAAPRVVRAAGLLLVAGGGPAAGGGHEGAGVGVTRRAALRREGHGASRGEGAVAGVAGRLGRGCGAVERGGGLVGGRGLVAAGGGEERAQLLRQDAAAIPVSLIGADPPGHPGKPGRGPASFPAPSPAPKPSPHAPTHLSWKSDGT